MPVLASAALGAYIGSTVATTLGFTAFAGAQVGWIVGSTLGGMLFGPKPEDGPRITDGKFASGAYGQFIPINYGTMRHKAQIIWFSGLHEHKDEVGGNSISDGANVYTYTCDFLASVCEGPQGVVLRIWANGRLIWTNNGLSGVADEEIIKADNVRVYLGDEDQQPDPLYEEGVGTENAPAYRGQVTIMFEGMQLAFAGNRPPVIEVEVARSGEAAAVCPTDPLHAVSVQRPGLFVGTDGVWGQLSSGNAYDAASKILYVVTQGEAGDTAKTIERYSCAGTAPTFLGAVTLPYWADSLTQPFVAGMAFDPVNEILHLAGGWNGPSLGLATSVPIELRYKDGVFTPSYQKFKNTIWDSGSNSNGAYHSGMYALYSTNSGEAGWWSHGTAILAVSIGALRNETVGDTFEYGVYHDDDRRYIRTAEVTYIPPDPGVIGDINIAWRWDVWEGYVDATDAQTTITGSDAADAQRFTGVVYAPSRKKVYICTRSSGIAVIDVSEETGDPTVLSRDLTAYPEDMTVMGGYAFFVWNNAGDALICGNIDGDTTRVRLIDPDTMDVLLECSFANSERISGPKDIGDGRFACILGTDKVAIIEVPTGGTAYGEPITLREIVEDVCARAGLPAENLDATAGTDLVDGYKIATQSTARAAIDNLRPAYFFDMPESGMQLVLKKRGGASVATIDDGELGARVFQATQTDPAPAYEAEHTQEIEIPRTVECLYIDASQDYDQGVQRAERQVGASLAPLRIDVPVSMSVDKAQQVAWVNLLLAHASKSTVKLSLPHAYMALDAADPIAVPLAGGTQRLRIETLTRARPMLEVDAIFEDAEIYEQTMTGGAPEQGPTQGTPTVLSDTVLALIDTTPLRDEDDSLAVYAAMGRAVRADSWSGGVAYKSVDDGSNWDSLYSTANSATIGYSTNALADFAGGNVWDDDSTLDVYLSSGTLSSATDIGVLNGMNALAIQCGTDWEIVQFVNAELIATNTWRISRLLRGRKGTERAISGHAANDRVVLLTASSLRVLSYGLGEVGVERDFLAVTNGQALADGAQQMVTMVGNTLRPLSPVQIEGSRDSDDLTITWIRRARINAEWRDLYDVPLDEPTESYEIDILDGDDVVRTLTASDTTAEYTAVQQTEDFGAPQAAVSIAIYQMSSRIGRGHAGMATI